MDYWPKTEELQNNFHDESIVSKLQLIPTNNEKKKKVICPNWQNIVLIW